MSCTKQHVSECMNHFRCWRLNKHIRFLGGCSTQTPPLSVCVIFKDRHVNCRGRIRLHIPDKSKLFFLAFTDGPFLADYGDVHHHYSDRHVNQSCSFSSRSVRTLPSAGPILSSTVAGCPAVFLPQTPQTSHLWTPHPVDTPGHQTEMTCSLHYNGPWGNPPVNIAAQFIGSSFVFLPVWLKTDVPCKQRSMEFNFGGQMEDVAGISCSFPQYTSEVCISMFFYISKTEVGTRADKNNPHLSLKSWF